MPRLSLFAVLAALASVPTPHIANRTSDRRIVDVVTVANALSERAHGYAGQADTLATVGGVGFRQTRGWMHFVLKTFDDTDVTLALTFLVTDSVSHPYDVVVEDSVVASKTYGAADRKSPLIELPVPFSLTKGKTNIVVLIRARDGWTPALREVRTIQDHNEVDLTSHSFGATR